MTPTSAALLAGGEGRRLGGVSKEGLAGGDRARGPSLGPSLARSLSERFDRVIVVTKNADLYKELPVLTLGDLRPGFGPLSGLHAALAALELETGGGGGGGGGKIGETDWLWLAACDMPHFDPRLVDLLAKRLETALAETPPERAPLACLARRAGHFEPFQALYSLALLPLLGTLLEEAALARLEDPEAPRSRRDPSFKELLARCPVLFVPEEEVRLLTPDWGLYFNINEPRDLERWRGAGREGGEGPL